MLGRGTLIFGGAAGFILGLRFGFANLAWGGFTSSVAGLCMSLFNYLTNDTEKEYGVLSRLISTGMRRLEITATPPPTFT